MSSNLFTAKKNVVEIIKSLTVFTIKSLFPSDAGGHVRPSLRSRSFLESPVACTDFTGLRVGRDAGWLNWFGLNYSCSLFFLSLRLTMPLSFSYRVRITWAHLFYKRDSWVDRLVFHTHTRTWTFLHTGLVLSVSPLKYANKHPTQKHKFIKYHAKILM